MRMPFSRVLLPVFAVLVVLNVSSARKAFAQDYYVSTTGSDSSGTGSVSQPWATIAHASTKVGAGATVHVAAGVYNGSFSTSASGTASAYITYVASTANFSGPVNCAQVAANHGGTTTCARLVGSSGTTWTNSGDYVAIEGFDVTGPGINGIYTQGNATMILNNHVHDILNSTCNSTGGSGINLNGTNAQVVGNYVHNIGPYPSSCGYVQGIYFLQAGGFAYNNISFANSGFGIQLWHFPSNIALVNNTIFNNATGGIVLGTDDSFTVDYITVSNNVVTNNGGAGVSEQGASSSSTGIHNIYTHNLVYGNSGSAFSLQNGLSASSTVTSAPQFVNYTGTSTGDYHLQSSSPAIGAATSNGAPSTDFDGNARPQNGSYDIGSYVYLAPSSAALTVTPNSVGFSSTDVGSTSPAQTVTLTNQSNSAVTLSSVAIAGTNSVDFTQSSKCGSSLAAGASCAIDLAFKPQTTGTLTATDTITPASGSVLQVGLSGTGVSATTTMSLSPTSLTFPSTLIGTTSAAESVTVTNTGNSTLTFSGAFGISGPFAFSGAGTCGSTVAAGASCTISVDFVPTSGGTATGAVTLSDNAGTQTIGLSGTGASSTASVSLSPTSLSFPSTAVGSTSAAEYVTLTNTGNATLTFSSAFSISGPFAFGGTGTCGSSVAAGASCTIGVVFVPTSGGTVTGAVTLNDNAGTQTIGLSGTGATLKIHGSPTRSKTKKISFDRDWLDQDSGVRSSLQTGNFRMDSHQRLRDQGKVYLRRIGNVRSAGGFESGMQDRIIL